MGGWTLRKSFSAFSKSNTTLSSSRGETPRPTASCTFEHRRSPSDFEREASHVRLVQFVHFAELLSGAQVLELDAGEGRAGTAKSDRNPLAASFSMGRSRPLCWRICQRKTCWTMYSHLQDMFWLVFFRASRHKTGQPALSILLGTFGGSLQIRFALQSATGSESVCR